MNLTVLSLLTKLLFANCLCLNAAAPKFTRVSWCTKQDNSQKKLELFCFVELEGLILFPVLVNLTNNAPTLRLGHWLVELEGLILFPVWVNHTNNALCIRKVCIFICRTPLQALLVGVLQIKMPHPYGWGIDLVELEGFVSNTYHTNIQIFKNRNLFGYPNLPPLKINHFNVKLMTNVKWFNCKCK